MDKVARAINTLISDIEKLLHNYVFTHYTALANYLWMFLGTIMAIGLTLYAYDVISGKATVSRDSVVRYGLGTSVIVLVMAGYSQWVGDIYNVVYHIPIQIGSKLANANGFGSFYHSNSIGQAIGHLYMQFEGEMKNEFHKVFQGTWAHLQFNGEALIAGIMTFILGIMTLLIAMAEMLAAMIGIAFAFSTLPLFIAFGLMKFSRPWLAAFINWMLAFSFVLILVPALLALIIQVDSLAMIKVSIESTGGVEDLIGVFITGIVAIYLLLQINGVAKAIVGSSAGSSGTAMMTGAFGAMGGFAAGRGLAKAGKGKWADHKDKAKTAADAAPGIAEKATYQKRINKWADEL